MKNNAALNEDKIQSFIYADIYRVLSKGFSYPDENNIGEIRAITEELLSFEELDENSYRYLERMLSAIDIKELQKEYSRLFLKGTIPTCDSSYNLNADALSIVATFYKAFGLTPKTGESPDSLPYELEFLAFLSLKKALAERRVDQEVADSAYRKFVKQNLAGFVEKFSVRVEEASPHPFYRTITEFLKVITENETV